MEKDRDSKLFVIVLLVVAIVGLSIGFAAFNKNLNIKFSESNVNVADDLDVRIVVFDSTNSIFNESSKIIEPILNGDGVSASPFIISDNYLSISGGSVIFTNNDQFVSYILALKNYGEHKAYLKSFSFKNYSETDSFKVCTALSGTDQNLVDQACESINLTFSALNDSFSFDSSTVGNIPLSTFDLSSQSYGIVKLNISYDANAVIPDGDFKINFGEIVLNYSLLSE